jgi:hypothetical protein
MAILKRHYLHTTLVTPRRLVGGGRSRARQSRELIEDFFSCCCRFGRDVRNEIPIESTELLFRIEIVRVSVPREIEAPMERLEPRLN